MLCNPATILSPCHASPATMRGMLLRLRRPDALTLCNKNHCLCRVRGRPLRTFDPAPPWTLILSLGIWLIGFKPCLCIVRTSCPDNGLCLRFSAMRCRAKASLLGLQLPGNSLQPRPYCQSRRKSSHLANGQRSCALVDEPVRRRPSSRWDCANDVDLLLSYQARSRHGTRSLTEEQGTPMAKVLPV